MTAFKDPGSYLPSPILSDCNLAALQKKEKKHM